jgi:hypothetical protein
MPWPCQRHAASAPGPSIEVAIIRKFPRTARRSRFQDLQAIDGLRVVLGLPHQVAQILFSWRGFSPSKGRVPYAYSPVLGTVSCCTSKALGNASQTQFVSIRFK